MADGDPASGPGASDTESGEKGRSLFLIAGLILLPVGLFGVVGFVTWDLSLLPMKIPKSPLAAGILAAAALVGVAGAVLLGWNLHRLRRAPGDAAAADGGGRGGGIDIYERYLIGIGYALLVVAIVNTILTAGFIETGKLESSSRDFLAKIHERGEHTDEGAAAGAGAGPPAEPAPGDATDAGSTEGPAAAGTSAPDLSTPEGGGDASGSGGAPGSAGGSAAEETGADGGEPGESATPGSGPAAGSGSDSGGEAAAPESAVWREGMEEKEVFSPELKIAFLIMLSCGMSILGALFFVANSLREKRTAGEQFVVGMFWSGLAFRLGEAVLFTFAFFWLFWKYLDRDYTWLPILALFVGMFVKTGEVLIFGIGKRILMASSTLFPTEPVQNGGGQGQPRSNGDGGAGGGAPAAGGSGGAGGGAPAAGGSGGEGGGGQPPAESGDGGTSPAREQPPAGSAGSGRPGGRNPRE